MLYWIYALVIFLSTLLGAFVGLGGGVIIKPMLDVLDMHTLAEISFFSSCAVFAMSVTSTAKYIKKGVSYQKKILFPLSAGAVLGGFLGNRAFSAALAFSASVDVKGVQSVMLCALLLCVLIFVNSHAKTAHLQNPIGILFVGLLLGALAAFLGIGGGPINVAAFALLFSFSVREAAVYSVAVILFSQLSNLGIQLVHGGVQAYDLKMLFVVLPCAVLGGLFGAVLNRKCSEKAARITFSSAIFFVMVISIYNAVTAFC